MPPLKGRQSHDLDEEIETIVKESVEEMEEEISFQEYQAMENKINNTETLALLKELNRQVLNLDKDVLAVDKSVLKHKKADHDANVEFGKELKAIHRFQGKWIIIVLILNFAAALSTGAVLHATSDVWLPYLGQALDGMKTASNLIK